MRERLAGRRIGGLLALVMVAIAVPASAEMPDAVRESLADMEGSIGAGIGTTISPVTGVVSFLSPPANTPVRVSLPATAAAENRARAFLGDWGAAFGVGDGREMALLRASAPDEVGIEHVRFQQTHRGVPITGGELVVHLRGSHVTAVNGKTLPGLEGVKVEPSLSPQEASVSAHRILEKEFGIADAELSEPRLELLNRGLLEPVPSNTFLAWFIEATRVDLREYIWIDAESGEELLRFSQLTDALSREIFDAQDASTVPPGDGVYNDLPGVSVREEGDGPTGDADADAAYDFSGGTYNYFSAEHGRDSYDDAGAKLDSTVHFCPSAAFGDCPYPNAFWNGTQMVYGEGFSASDDVVAHELTHAVTEHTANLFYYMQSGALNESYSDIFGEAIDLTYTGGAKDDPDAFGSRSDGTCSALDPGPTGDNSYRWLLGEDVPGFGAIRDMWHPNCFSHPGRMSDPWFDCGDPGNDRGGVHRNSGVPNHAFALMVDGGTYNGISVVGIGMEWAARIQYRVLANYLTSASDFRDNYDALLQACADLSDTPGFPALGCLQVKKALDAVEMGNGWPCASPSAHVPPPAYCPAGQAPSLWHYWDVEGSGIAACPSDVLPTAEAFCLNSSSSIFGTYATSGDKSYWGFNLGTASNYSLLISASSAGLLPPGARMQFNHSHGFSNSGSTFFDGGQVELLDSFTYVDGGPFIIAGQPYGGTINSSSNPLNGESAFVADSRGYTASQLNLSSFAGQTFKYRFRVGTNTGGNDFGWFIDDIRIYTCGLCAQNRTLGNGYNGMADTYRASVSIGAGNGFKVGALEEVLLTAPEVRLENDFEAHGDLTLDNTACIYLPPG